jgi:multidrug resistance efflux pump
VIAFILICYGGLYFLLFEKLTVLKKTTANISAFVGVGVVIISAIVFSWYTYSPVTSDARMVRYIIPIVPNVKGRVIDVSVQAMETIEKGEVLFSIDPAVYEFNARRLQATIEQLQAQKRLAEANLKRAKALLKTQAAAKVDVERWQAEFDIAVAGIAATQAQLDDANWQLQETVVRAPYTGFVANLQLRPGQYVTTVPLASPMAFVSNEESDLVASFSQSAIRRVSVGDAVEVVFSTKPGQVFSGKIKTLVKVSAGAQLTASSSLPSLTGAPVTDRWAVRVTLDDQQLASELPQGAGGTLAVYTDAGAPLHIISKVALRMNAWLAYLTAP